jgi:hypothetical protein
MLHVSRDHIRVLWFKSFIVCFLMSGCGSQCLRWLWIFCVLHGCGVPVSNMIVEFQCLIWLWNSSVSYGCGIPVSHRLWTSSVSPVCGIIVSYRLWTSSVSSGCELPVSYSVLHGCGIPVSHRCGIPVYPMVVEFQCLTWLIVFNISLLWYFSVSHDGGIRMSHKTMVFQYLVNMAVPGFILCKIIIAT